MSPADQLWIGDVSTLPAAKQALRDTTAAAAAAGGFGAPTFVVHTDVGPQLFWGGDRMDMVLRAASRDARVCFPAA